MSDLTLMKAFNFIDESNGDFDGEKPQSLIEKAEKTLGLYFPRSYKAFLQKYGCGDADGVEFYGVINDDFENSSVPDAIWLTLEERKTGLPNHLVIISSSGDGSYYALDTSKMIGHECPVILVGIDGDETVTHENFASFVTSSLSFSEV